MPELPDVELYCARLRALYGGHVLEGVRLGSPFLLRSVSPPLSEVAGKRVLGFSRLGKRIVWELEGDLFMVLHLMIAGRLHEKKPGTKVPAKVGMAAFDFAHKTLMLTEANTQKRASLHVVRGADAVADFDPGGLEVLEIGRDAFAVALTAKNHTLKRALTDPTLFSGIGNAYSDEILFA
ncbi:MAG: formamidopyrimidine-DNA glycosylase, partial [Myxococcales bacterium]|nr:formamidopyrimidine-DNA glycosylase [Myxococcales bacterium]